MWSNDEIHYHPTSISDHQTMVGQPHSLNVPLFHYSLFMQPYRLTYIMNGMFDKQLVAHICCVDAIFPSSSNYSHSEQKLSCNPFLWLRKLLSGVSFEIFCSPYRCLQTNKSARAKQISGFVAPLTEDCGRDKQRFIYISGSSFLGTASTFITLATKSLM